MPDFTVNLDVRNWASSGSDGYTNTTASNKAVYCYKYSGGSDGNGGVEESANAGTGIITVTVGTDQRYKVSDITFTGDIQSQLSRVVPPNSNTGTITDTDTSSGDGYYSVIVADTAANCTFACDPPIVHKPR